mmetsp:Transcript_40785/g.97747  ORF Transcript_40785/g.97747 Transcript_40785/m.97747 type:complete len:218 (+) Transcript_40785:692-1345(+)
MLGLDLRGVALSGILSPVLSEDKELVDLILKGEWVPPAALNELNEQRRLKGQPYLLIHPGRFDDDRSRIPKLRAQARADYAYLVGKAETDMKEINENCDLQAICDTVNRSSAVDPDSLKGVEEELGEWFVEWLKFGGYRAHQSPQLFKQMIMTSFPVMTQDPEFTPENLEPALLNYLRLLRGFRCRGERPQVFGRSSRSCIGKEVVSNHVVGRMSTS